jgi:streptogramin lyase
VVGLARPHLDQRVERRQGRPLRRGDAAVARVAAARPVAAAYAVYVDERDIVWLTDFGANAFVRFDPRTNRFTTVRLASAGANVRQLLGRRGEVWGAESGVDKLVVVQTTTG